LEDAQEYNMNLYQNDTNERNKMKIINKFINKNAEILFQSRMKRSINTGHVKTDSDSHSNEEEQLTATLPNKKIVVKKSELQICSLQNLNFQ